MNKFRLLKKEEIDVRVSQIASNWLTLLLYKDARVDMDILDETVGCLNWKREHLRDNANCVVSIYDEEKKEWVSKEDTGTESFSEAEKGLASDSFKRACVNWGIGRELYTSPGIIVFPMKEMIPKGKDGEFYPYKKDKEGNEIYTTKTRFFVDYINYDEDRNISDLIIVDNKRNLRFCQLTKEREKYLLDLQKEVEDLINKVEGKDSKFNREDILKVYPGYWGETQLNEIKAILKKKLGAKNDK